MPDNETWEKVDYFDARQIIPSIFPGARVTSTSRSRSDPLSRKNPRSPHIDNPNAFDVAPIKGMTYDQFLSGLKNAGYEVSNPRDEVTNPVGWATGPHWHGVITKGPSQDETWEPVKSPEDVVAADPLAGAVAAPNPNDPLTQKLFAEQGGNNPAPQTPEYTGWGLDPKGETMQALGYADFMEPGLDPAQRVGRFLKSIPASAISTGAAGFQAAQSVVDALSKGADKLWDGTPLDEAVANLYGVHMRPSELIGGAAEAFPLGGIEFGGFKPGFGKGVVESLDDQGNVIASTADDGPGLTGSVTDESPALQPHEIAKQQLEEHLATPRTPEEHAAVTEVVNDIAEQAGVAPEVVASDPSFRGDVRAGLLERNVDQMAIERPPVEEVVPNPAAPEGRLAGNDNVNEYGFDPHYVENPKAVDPIVRDGELPEAANDQIGTPETFELLNPNAKGKNVTQDVTTYTDEEARKLIEERTGQVPPPPRSMAMEGDPGESIKGPILEQHPDGIPLALSKEPLGGGSGEPPQPPKNVVERLTEDLKTAGKARAEQDQLYKEERAKRFKDVDVAQTPGMGQKALEYSKAALKGELPKADFESVAHKYSQEDVDELFENIIAKPTLTNMQKVSAQDGLMKLMQGKVPQPKEFQYLSEVFPKEFIKAALSKRDVFSKSFGKFGEAWNMPKSLMSSMDLSAPLRQGIGLSHRSEYWKSSGEMFKYAVSQNKFDMLDEAIKTHPNYALADESGLSLTVAGGKLGPAEDAFRSHLAEKLPVIGPIVRGSERAYVGFLNKLRFDTFNSLVADAERLGHDLKDPAVTKGISRYINVMTGRGGLGKLEPAAGALNGALFSPHLISSRLQMLAAPAQAVAGKGMIADLPKGLRKEAAKSYAAMIGAYSTAIGLASLAGYEVVSDPRSSDFGKIRDGNTRVDLGAGLIQYITAGTRALMRESTSVKSGETRELKRRGDTPLDTDLKFIFNKLHPSLSLVVDQQRGTDAVGQPANASAELPVVGDIGVPWSKAILSRISPMGVPDIYQTLKEHPDQKGALYATLGMLGAGLQNFDDGSSTSTAPVTIRETNDNENTSTPVSDTEEVWTKVQ